MPAPAPVTPLGFEGPPAFEEVYRQHVGFVWRSLRRLGVPKWSLDDATQDVFLVVYRRLAEFEGRSELTTWLYRIAYHTAQHYFRSGVRHPSVSAQDTSDQATPGSSFGATVSTNSASDAVSFCPQEVFTQKQAVERLYSILDQLDHDKRVVFVMAELEQMSAPDIAAVLQLPANTVYSRLRAARQHFNALIEQLTVNERSLS